MKKISKEFLVKEKLKNLQNNRKLEAKRNFARLIFQEDPRNEQSFFKKSLKSATFSFENEFQNLKLKIKSHKTEKKTVRNGKILEKFIVTGQISV